MMTLTYFLALSMAVNAAGIVAGWMPMTYVGCGMTVFGLGWLAREIQRWR